MTCEGCHINDLRGQEHRSVSRGDAVVITGAEYLRNGRLLLDLEAERDRYRDALREIAQREGADDALDWHWATGRAREALS